MSDANTMVGRCSKFGGPDDTGMGEHEGVALYMPGDRDPFELFLPGRVGWGRGLNPAALYCAMRWDIKHFGTRDRLRRAQVRVRSARTGKEVFVHPADWGPAKWTKRIIDLSPAALQQLGIVTDENVDVTIEVDGQFVRL